MSTLIWLGIGAAGAGVIESLPSVAGPGEDQGFRHAQPAGDLDGDGLGDLALGAPYDDNDNGHEAGAVWIVYGADWDAVDRWTPIADIGQHLRGELSQDHAGFDIAAIGDSDGDGLDDLLASAPDASSDYPGVGRIYIIQGELSDVDRDLGDFPYLYGAERFSHAGWSVHAAGDLDGDALSDFMIATPYPMASGDPGVAHLAVFYGRAAGWPEASPILFSYSNSEADQNTTADAAFLVYDNGAFTGRSAAAVPDWNGDGLPDVVVGAPGYTDTRTRIDPAGAPPPHGGIGPDEGGGAHTHELPEGAAYLFLTRERGDNVADPFQTTDDAIGIIRGAEPGDNFPWILGATADGALLASAPEALATGGAAYLFEDFSGELRADEAAVRWEGSTPGDLLGWGMAPADGIDDRSVAAVGAPGWSAGLGQVLLVERTSGPAEAAATETLKGCWPESLAGTSVRSHPGPDPTGQDRPWLGITAPGASVYADRDGLAYVLTADDLGSVGEDCDLPEIAGPDDADADGVSGDEDCDDGAPWIYPGAPEVCADGVDDDCDGAVDESCGPDLAPVAAGCGGCAAGGGSGGWWLLATLAGAAITSRRRARPTGHPPPVLGLAALLLAPAAARAQEGRPLVRVWGSAAEEYLQGPVVSGDYDGDGQPDLAVANYRGYAYYYAPGEVHLLGHDGVAGDVYLATIRNSIFGLTEHDYLGYDLTTLPSGVPGEPDALLIGETFAGLTANEPGAALLFPGPLAGSAVLPADSATLGIQGDDNSDRLGDTVRRVGDLDGDGLTEVVVTAPVRDLRGLEWAGTAYIFHDDLTLIDSGGYQAPSLATATIEGPAEHLWAGWRALGPGDINGDGYDDLVIGALGDPDATFTGELHVFLGVEVGEALTTDMADGTWTTEAPESYLGYGLEGGDLDGDGRGEVVVSSYTADSGAGRVWLLDGPPAGVEDIDAAAAASWQGEPGSGSGFSVGLGPAILIGAPYLSQVIVLDTELEAIGTIEGEGALGHWVGWVDDFDDDGVPEAALVAPEASNDLVNQGAAYILSGADVLDGVFPASGIGLMDADGDGADVSEDCNDADPREVPGGDEVCRDGLDNDCDGTVDEQEACVGGCSSAPRPHETGYISLILAAALAWRRRCSSR